MVAAARVLRVIETHLALRGDGTEGDPKRLLTQYWSVDGELLATVDPCASPASKSKQDEQT